MVCFRKAKWKNKRKGLENCLECNAELDGYQFKFCSSHCNALASNKSPNRKSRRKERYCKRCGISLKIYLPKRRILCDSCREENENSRWENQTLDFLASKKKSSSYHSVIRGLARELYKKSKNPMSCFECGYSKYVEICHIKQVKEFPKETLVSEVNNLENLVALCRNHHWEMDHGDLVINLGGK